MYNFLLLFFYAFAPYDSYVSCQPIRAPVCGGRGVGRLRGSAPVIHQDQGYRRGRRAAGLPPSPWPSLALENRRYHAVSTEGEHSSRGSQCGSNPLLAHGVGVPVIAPLHTRALGKWDTGWDSGQSALVGVNQPHGELTATAPLCASSKRLGRLKRDLIPPHLITSTRQLVRHGLEGHNPLGLLLLALLMPLNLGIGAPRTVGHLDKRPGHILMAVFGVPLAFPLAMAALVTVHAPAIGSQLPHAATPLAGTGLYQDG